ncbi:MAG: bifunctional glutamate N-acetyltransferase/amino-acid acetyltransferase ArgJ [Dehalococcoidia bacterium]|nr:MAG: bifunctional glutamate N-acetyltransferase/amino-acid acetyltransferase ArgJ [Dehalococcoidia bacterium]
MKTDLTYIPNGTVTSPRGFSAGATYGGINKHARYNLDVGILYSDVPCNAAGTFTTNKIKAASVLLCQRILPSKSVRAIVANSGCANASTGEFGQRDAQSMEAAAAAKIGVDMADVLVASTGVIGRRLPLELLNGAIGKIKLSPDGGHDMAKAIMTTDTVPKEIAIETGGFVIGGIAKGAGMIHPNMATMLSFLATDAPVELGFLEKSLKEAVDKSFNMISVDGDTSPNDSVIMLSNGLAGGEIIKEGSARAKCFQQALDAACIHLAKSVARDGEGATKLIEVNVSGAASISDARIAARTITSSPLVKSAIHGADPNWGRIVVAAGRSGAELVEAKMALDISDVPVVREGVPLPFDKDKLIEALGRDEVRINLDLNLGTSYSATAWGCDLSAEYVAINSEYTT